jgi:hypothetical protein
MTFQTRPDPKLIRASIAVVWLYEGLWCKLLGGVPRHADVIAAAPFIGPGAARAALIALGLAECGIRRMGLVWAANAPGGPSADCAARRDERGGNDLGEAPDSRPWGHDRAEPGFPGLDLDCCSGG